MAGRGGSVATREAFESHQAERGSERFPMHEIHAVSNAELLAMVLNHGSHDASALQRAQDLLDEAGGIAELTRDKGHLLRLSTLGIAEATVLCASIELACRIAKAKLPKRNLLDAPEAVANYLELRYPSPDQEIFGALFLDVRNHLISEIEVFRGTLTRALVEPRAIFKEALIRSASGVLVWHCHPSGNPTPSPQDLAFTHRLVEVGELMGIRLIDHLILGFNGHWVSLSRQGALGGSS